MPYTRDWGSRTAKGGFEIEAIVAETFEEWRSSPDAEDWLTVMSYDPQNIESVSASTPRGTGKADVILKIKKEDESGYFEERISVKKTKNSSYNQVSKRTVDDYAEMFDFSELTVKGLKKYCGEEGYRPKDLVEKGELDSSELEDLYDASWHDPPIRLSFKELSKEEKEAIKKDFNEKHEMIVKTILAGDPKEVDWYLAVRAQKKNEHYNVEKTLLEPIEQTVERYARGGFRPPSRSSFKVGKITVQRKGGTPDPEKLQFKMNPWEIEEERSAQQEKLL